MDQHHGEMLKLALQMKGFNFSTICKKVGKTRSWLYYQFDRPVIPAATWDLLEKATGISLLPSNSVAAEPTPQKSTDTESAAYWEAKYRALQEDYLKLVKRYHNILDNHDQ